MWCKMMTEPWTGVCDQLHKSRKIKNCTQNMISNHQKVKRNIE